MKVKFSKSFSKAIDQLSGKQLNSVLNVIREVKAAQGIEDITDGTLIYTDYLIEKAKKAFGVELPKKVAFDDIDKTAKFIIDEIITPQLEKNN